MASGRSSTVVALIVALLAAPAPLAVTAASPPPSGSAPSGSLPSGSLPSGSPSSTAQVVLLDAGAEPRSELRYHYSSGDAMTMSMDMQMTVDVAVEGVAVPPTELPPMHFGAAMQFGDVSPSGVARYEFRYTAAGVVDPGGATAEVVDAIDAGLAGMVGVTGWAVVDDRGATLDGGFAGLDSLDPSIRSMLEGSQRTITEMSAPLPLEAVGVGGRWALEQHVHTSGIVVDQTANYTLEERTADTLRLSLAITQAAAPGPIELPGLPAGTTADLKEYTGRGTGSMVITPGELIPVSELTLESRNVIAAGGSQVTTDTTVTFRIAPGTAGPDPSLTSSERVIRAHHILLAPNHDPGAARGLPRSDVAWEIARVEAVRIVTLLRQIPDRASRRAAFEARAQADSDDTDSGAMGGDLGSFTRDVMVPGFADALFDAVDPRPSDIIGPVSSEFGWHVIMYDGEGDTSN
ncbi:MAG: peptidyl-prolyl cis-trans isomerase [Chloroflexi bacterium]|nr:peptidyl-prolyl cis-trans isomerase [Chloroflexota bacterium]